MKSIQKFILGLFLSISSGQAQETINPVSPERTPMEQSIEGRITMLDFVGKWNMTGYIFDAQPRPLEKSKKNDYIRLEANNTFTEIKSGKFDKGYWEYLPVGNMLMFYDPWKEGFQPMKVVKVGKRELQLLLTWQGGSTIIVFSANSTTKKGN